MSLFRITLALLASGGVTWALIKIENIPRPLRILLSIGAFLGVIIAVPQAWDATQNIGQRMLVLRDRLAPAKIEVDSETHNLLFGAWENLYDPNDSKETVRKKIYWNMAKLDALKSFFAKYGYLPASPHSFARDTADNPHCTKEVVAPAISTFWCLN